MLPGRLGGKALDGGLGAGGLAGRLLGAGHTLRGQTSCSCILFGFWIICKKGDILGVGSAKPRGCCSPASAAE